MNEVVILSMYVITHKKFKYKLSANYKPLLVGADFNQNSMGYLADNTKENISNKNKSFCELTGMYWLWKNCKDKYIGISHYRRYFSNKNTLNGIRCESLFTGVPRAISVKKLDGYLQSYDWIVPKKEKLSTNHVTVYEQFKLAHNIEDLEKTKKIIQELYPDYIDAFDKVMSKTEMFIFNMLYTSKEQYDSYCKWLFDILFALEKQTDISDYDEYQQRLYGFIAERLFNVWLEKNSVKVKQLLVFNTSTENRQELIRKVKNKL